MNGLWDAFLKLVGQWWLSSVAGKRWDAGQQQNRKLKLPLSPAGLLNSVHDAPYTVSLAVVRLCVLWVLVHCQPYGLYFWIISLNSTPLSFCRCHSGSAVRDLDCCGVPLTCLHTAAISDIPLCLKTLHGSHGLSHQLFTLWLFLGSQSPLGGGSKPDFKIVPFLCFLQVRLVSPRCKNI